MACGASSFECPDRQPALPEALQHQKHDDHRDNADQRAIATDTLETPEAFYLVYGNRSRANALKGGFSGLRRALVERRARGSLEENLRHLKIELEKRW